MEEKEIKKETEKEEVSYIVLKPSQIKVRKELKRLREDLGDVNGLANSFKRTKQILPIIINRNNELIDGGRRLAACALAGITVKCVYEDIVDSYAMRELEIEANLYRKNLTPAEEAIGIRELHKFKQEKYGVGGSGGGGKTDSSWDITKTANLIGKSRGSVYNALELADLVDKFPQLKNATKSSEIKKAAKGFEKLQKTMDGLEKNKLSIESGNSPFTIIKGDAIEHMISMKNNSVDIILTDPLYGIDADKLVQGLAGNPNSTFHTSGYKIEDSTDKAMLSYKILAKESFRFTKDDSHGYIFVGPEYFHILRDIFMAEGWKVHVKPLIWIKRTNGQCNVPSSWPSSCYEMLLYIRKDNSKLVLEGKPDWIECPIVNPSDRIHPYQKPVPLLINLLERVSLPGMNVYDPFAGSGSTLEAATKLKLFSTGVDESAEAYACMIERMEEFKDGNN
jgi:DNA modification methylase